MSSISSTVEATVVDNRTLVAALDARGGPVFTVLLKQESRFPHD